MAAFWAVFTFKGSYPDFVVLGFDLKHEIQIQRQWSTLDCAWLIGFVNT
jgi:hypothetical protein